MLSNQEREWVDMWIADGIHPDNLELVRRTLERMRSELDGLTEFLRNL